MTHVERGKLLFSLRDGKAIRRYQPFLWMLAAMVVLTAADLLYSSYRGGRTHWGMAAAWGGYAIAFTLRVYFRGRDVGFYENGIVLPENPDAANVPRFFPWAQIERYYWEGDVLTIVPGTSFLAGGGGSVGLPMTGGSVSVPPAKRSEVEKLLSAAPAI